MSDAVPPAEQVLLEAPRFRVVRRNYPDQEGAMHVREVIVHPGAVVILPLLDEDRVCLIRNYRVAVHRELIELPAGTRDPSERSLATAQRELTEETGFEAAQWEQLPGFCMSPGILNEQMDVFVARGLTPGSARREPGELIHNLIVTWDEALAMCRDGRIEDAKTLAAFFRYELSRRSAG